ncbi:MAG: response regulator [Scytonematopsis contorta HA4267-MV1]|jgi:CheY-like chemotaxis protein|nr:response regulator [Scytonematopsis contorta HA4267-MV1]
MSSTSYFSKPIPGKGRILVVDDVVDNFLLVQVILEEEGYEVEFADNGREALKMIESEPPNMVLLDMMMPDMDGFEVARRIRENSKYSSLPILFVTAYDELVSETKINSVADGLIKKPIDFDELIDRVQTALVNTN